MFGIHTRCDEEIKHLRNQVRMLQERNDRLTMALADKSGTPLTIPAIRDIVEPVAEAPIPGPTTDPGMNAWWKAVGGSPRVSSPVKEAEVSAPS